MYVPSEMPASPPSGETEWADGDFSCGRRHQRVTHPHGGGGNLHSWLCLDVVSSGGSGLDEVT